MLVKIFEGPRIFRPQYLWRSTCLGCGRGKELRAGTRQTAREKLKQDGWRSAPRRRWLCGTGICRG